MPANSRRAADFVQPESAALWAIPTDALLLPRHAFGVAKPSLAWIVLKAF